jgi:Met-zincin/Domain of unknown function (DUF5117)
MKRMTAFLAFVLGLSLALGPLGLNYLRAQAASPREIGQQAIQKIFRPGNSPKPAPKITAPDISQSSTGASPEGKPSSGPKRPGEESDPFRPFELVTKDANRTQGLLTLYRNEKNGKLYAEILPEQLERNFLMVMTLESGIGEKGLYSGMPAGDFLFRLRRVNNTVQFVVPNNYFRATQGTPMRRSIDRSFSDSVLEVLPIRSIHSARKSLLVELNPLLLGDLPGIGSALGSIAYAPNPNRTYFGQVKNLPLNVEIESIFGFDGGGGGGPMPSFFQALPDSRAFDLKLRYSISELPENTGYKPRLADDRLGYFITAFQDFNDDSQRQPFVRYINRWQLDKKDPSAAVSEPREPITFWIENTVPVEYREAVRDGILMWNQAFEKIGFKDAVVAKQMPDKADWDPADVRYNTIRWFNSTDAIFAMGPSRVNPLTGQILDADIVVDANFVRSLKQEYRTIIEQNQESTVPFVSALIGKQNLCNYGPAGKQLARKQKEAPKIGKLRFTPHPIGTQDLCYGIEAAQQFALGNMHLQLMQNNLPSSPEMKVYVNQFLRELIAHEVGHTLGLRHNFRASAMLKPEELNNTELTRQKGLVASVMDYTAVNLAPQGTKQGEYYTSRVGPYDEWAISYGYSTTGAKTPMEERSALQKIANRAAEPDLAYATDEDVFSFLDPQTNLFDLSSNLLTYGQWQMDNARAMWKRLEQRYPLQGESFNDVRVAFNAVFGYYFQYASFLTNYVGGQSFNRYRYGDSSRLPFESVSLVDQRLALDVIQKNVFDEKAFQFEPSLLNKLAPSRWDHWGANPAVFRLDYPIFESVLTLQSITLYDLLSYDRLSRLRDGELKNPSQTLPIPELFDRLQSGIWGEVLNPGDRVQLSGLRRALQREYMGILIGMVLRQDNAPEDARTVARYELRQLRDAIGKAVRKVDRKDIYTLAHLEEAQDRIAKAIEAPLRGA